jgi:hypothetical protein
VELSGTKVLPLVAKQVILQLNEMFIEIVGPIGQELAEDIFEQWVLAGKFGPAAIRHYAEALSEQLDIAADRQAFLQKAEKLLLQ